MAYRAWCDLLPDCPPHNCHPHPWVSCKHSKFILTSWPLHLLPTAQPQPETLFSQSFIYMALFHHKGLWFVFRKSFPDQPIQNNHSPHSFYNLSPLFPSCYSPLKKLTFLFIMFLFTISTHSFHSPPYWIPNFLRVRTFTSLPLKPQSLLTGLGLDNKTINIFEWTLNKHGSV